MEGKNPEEVLTKKRVMYGLISACVLATIGTFDVTFPTPVSRNTLITGNRISQACLPLGSNATIAYRYMKEHMTQLRSEAKKIRRAESARSQNKTLDGASLHKKNEATNTSEFPFRVHFFTYSTENLAATRERLLIEAECTGWFASAQAYGPCDLPKRFRREFHDILESPRGGGYFLWKYPVMEMMLNSVPLGDYIVFADAGCLINTRGRDRLIEWIQKLEATPGHDFLGFELEHKEESYTTERIFQAFSITANNSNIRRSNQIVGGIKLIRNGANAREIVAKSYEILASDPYIITDRYDAESHAYMNRVGREGTFVGNRHDQSVSSVTLKQMGAVIIPDETWPPDLNSDSPILAGRQKKVSVRHIEVLRKWKAKNCTGTHPLNSKRF